MDTVNLLLEISVFPEGLKETVILLLLKKPSLDPVDPANYHPVWNLTCLGKVTESVEAEQFQKFLDETSAYNPFQPSPWDKI